MIMVPLQDAIEVTPRSVTFDAEGGTADVIVSSTGEWTLTAAAEYDWVEASKLQGADGDVITFTVQPNLEVDKKADFTFATGEEGATKCTFSVFSYAGEAPALNLVSEASVDFGYEADLLEIVVSTNQNHYRDVEYTLSEGAAEWLDYQATLPGDTEADAKLYFNVAALEGLADRQATVTVSVPGLTPVEVEVAQFAKHVLSTPSPRYTIAVEGETINIPLVANVEYSISMEGAEGWLTYGEATAEGIPFTAVALEDGKRAATVTFAQTDAVEGETPLTCSITITQVTPLVHWAADMRFNRLFPKWDGANGGPGACTEFTLESLVYITEFPSSQTLATLMGIEGQFLLRFGDSGVPLNNLQIATSCGNHHVTEVTFEANRWYHIAVTFANGGAKVYVDGEMVSEKTEFKGGYSWSPTYLTSVNLSPAWSYEPTGNRAFWMGYAYDQNRSLPGYMTEIRIWTKALTADEINAENHFYNVDPASEGLFSYWKFTEGEGSTIADKTANGNTLYGETDIAKDPVTEANKGPAGIEWFKVALPDR